MKRKRIPTEEEIDNIFERFGVERRTVMAKEVATKKLKPHPKNELIYGQDENVEALAALIEENGKIINPLIINKENIIISGHRRWMAAQQLGYETVPCEVLTFESEEAELEALISYNASREKTTEQKAREGMTLEGLISEKAKKRRLATLKQNQSTDMDDATISEELTGDEDENDKGTTRDNVAKLVGISSGKQYDRMKAVLKKADELKSKGNNDDSSLLTTLLNKSITTAHEFSTKADLASISPEDKARLRNGEVSPRSFTKTVGSAANDKPKTDYKLVSEQLSTIESSVKELGELLRSVGDDKKNQRTYARIEKQIKSLQNMLPTSGSALPEDEANS